MGILLHLGVWKTGSSAVQVALQRYADVLAAAGITIPRYAMQPNGCHQFANALRRGDNAAIARALADIRDAARRLPGGVVIVSSEHLWTLRPRQVDLLAGALALTDLPVRVLAYLRPQDALWNSVYAQQARMMQVLPQHAVWGRHGFAAPGLASAFEFGRVFKRHARLFGRRNVMLRRYDRQCFAGGDVVGDLLEAAVPGAGPLAPPRQPDVHPSLGWKGVALAVDRAAMLRRHGQPDPAVAGAYRRALARATAEMAAEMAVGGDGAWLGQGARVIAPAERRTIRAAYAEGNADLVQRFRLEDGFFDGGPDLPAEPRALTAIPAPERAEALARFEAALEQDHRLALVSA